MKLLLISLLFVSCLGMETLPEKHHHHHKKSSSVIINIESPEPSTARLEAVEVPQVPNTNTNRLKIAAIAAGGTVITSLIAAGITLSIHFTQCK